MLDAVNGLCILFATLGLSAAEVLRRNLRVILGLPERSPQDMPDGSNYQANLYDETLDDT